MENETEGDKIANAIYTLLECNGGLYGATTSLQAPLHYIGHELRRMNDLKEFGHHHCKRCHNDY